MKIHDLEFFLAAVAPSDAAAPTRSLLVRIATASGLEGWGESSLGWRMGELAARARRCWRCWQAVASTTSRSCTRWRRCRPPRCGRRSKWPCGTCWAACCGSRCAICWADITGGACLFRFA